MSGFSEWESDLSSIIEKTNQNLRLLRRINDDKRTDLSTTYDVSTTRPGGLKAFASNFSPRKSVATPGRHAVEDSAAQASMVHPSRHLRSVSTIDTFTLRPATVADSILHNDNATREVRSASTIGRHNNIQTRNKKAHSMDVASAPATRRRTEAPTQRAIQSTSKNLDQLRNSYQVELSALSTSLEKKMSDLRTDLNILSAENAVVTDHLHQVQETVANKTNSLPDALLKLTQVDETVAKLDKQATLLVGWKASMDQEVWETSTKVKSLTSLPDRTSQVEKELSQLVQTLTTTTPRLEESINSVRDRIANAELLLQKMPDQKTLEHAMQHKFTSELNELELRIGQKIEFLAQKIIASEKTIYTSRLEQMTSLKQDLIDEMQAVNAKLTKKADVGALQSVQNSFSEQVQHLQMADERTDKKTHELKQQMAALRDEILASRDDIIKMVSAQQNRTTEALEDKLTRMAKDLNNHVEFKLEQVDKRSIKTHESLQQLRAQQQTLQKLELEKRVKQQKLSAQCVKTFSELEKLRLSKTKAQESLQKMRSQREKSIASLEKQLAELQERTKQSETESMKQLQELQLSQALVAHEKQTLQIACDTHKRWNKALKSKMTSLRERLAMEREKARLEQQELTRKLELSQQELQQKLREIDQVTSQLQCKEQDLHQFQSLSQREVTILYTTKEAKETQNKLLQLRLEAAKKAHDTELSNQQMQFQSECAAKEHELELLVFENKQQINHLQQTIAQLEIDSQQAKNEYEQLAKDKLQATSERYEQRLTQVFGELATKDQETARLLETTVSKLAFEALQQELASAKDAKTALLQQIERAETQMEAHKANHAKEKDELTSFHSNATQEITSLHSKEKDELTSRHSKEKQELMKDKEDITFFYTTELNTLQTQLQTQLTELQTTQQALRKSDDALRALGDEYASQKALHDTTLRKLQKEFEQIQMDKQQLESQVERLITAKTNVELQLHQSQTVGEETAMQKASFEKMARECQTELAERRVQLQELQAREQQATNALSQMMREKTRLQRDLEQELVDLKDVLQRQNESHEMNELAMEENLQLLKLELVQANHRNGELTNQLTTLSDTLHQSEVLESQSKTDLTSQLESLSQSLNQSQDRETSLKQQTQKLTSQIQSFKDSLQQSQRREDESRQKEMELSTQLTLLGESLAQSQERESQLQQSESALLAELDALRDEMAQRETGQDVLQHRETELSAQVTTLTHALEQSESQTMQLQQSESQLAAQLNLLSNALKQSESRESVLQAHERELTSQIQQLTQQLAQSDAQVHDLQQREHALVAQLATATETLRESEQREDQLLEHQTELTLQLTTTCEALKNSQSHLNTNEADLAAQLTTLSLALKQSENRETKLNDSVLQLMDKLQVGALTQADVNDDHDEAKATLQERMERTPSRVHLLCDELVMLRSQLQSLQEEKQMWSTNLATYQVDLEQARSLLQDLLQTNVQLTTQLQTQEEQLAHQKKSTGELLTELQSMVSAKLQQDQELEELSRELESLQAHAEDQTRKHEQEMEVMRLAKSQLEQTAAQIHDSVLAIDQERQTKLRQTQMRIEKLQAGVDQLQFEAEVDQRVSSSGNNSNDEIASLVDRHAQIEHEIVRIKQQLKGDVPLAHLLRLQTALTHDKSKMSQLTELLESQEQEMNWDEEVLQNAGFMTSFLALSESKQLEFYQHFAQQAPLLVEQVKQIEAQWKAWNDEAMRQHGQEQNATGSRRLQMDKHCHDDELHEEELETQAAASSVSDLVDEHDKHEVEEHGLTSERGNSIPWRQIQDPNEGSADQAVSDTFESEYAHASRDQDEEDTQFVDQMSRQQPRVGEDLAAADEFDSSSMEEEAYVELADEEDDPVPDQEAMDPVLSIAIKRVTSLDVSEPVSSTVEQEELQTCNELYHQNEEEATAAWQEHMELSRLDTIEEKDEQVAEEVPRVGRSRAEDEDSEPLPDWNLDENEAAEEAQVSDEQAQNHLESNYYTSKDDEQEAEEEITEERVAHALSVLQVTTEEQDDMSGLEIQSEASKLSGDVDVSDDRQEEEFLEMMDDSDHGGDGAAPDAMSFFQNDGLELSAMPPEGSHDDDPDNEFSLSQEEDLDMVQSPDLAEETERHEEANEALYPASAEHRLQSDFETPEETAGALMRDQDTESETKQEQVQELAVHQTESDGEDFVDDHQAMDMDVTFDDEVEIPSLVKEEEPQRMTRVLPQRDGVDHSCQQQDGAVAFPTTQTDQVERDDHDGASMEHEREESDSVAMLAQWTDGRVHTMDPCTGDAPVATAVVHDSTSNDEPTIVSEDMSKLECLSDSGSLADDALHDEPDRQQTFRCLATSATNVQLDNDDVKDLVDNRMETREMQEDEYSLMARESLEEEVEEQKEEEEGQEEFSFSEQKEEEQEELSLCEQKEEKEEQKEEQKEEFSFSEQKEEEQKEEEEFSFSEQKEEEQKEEEEFSYSEQKEEEQKDEEEFSYSEQKEEEQKEEEEFSFSEQKEEEQKDEEEFSFSAHQDEPFMPPLNHEERPRHETQDVPPCKTQDVLDGQQLLTHSEDEDLRTNSWRTLTQAEDHELVEEEIVEEVEEDMKQDDQGQDDDEFAQELQLSDSFEVSHDSSGDEDFGSESARAFASVELEATTTEAASQLTAIEEGGAELSGVGSQFTIPSQELKLSSLQDSSDSADEDSLEFLTQFDTQTSQSQLTIAEQEIQEMDTFEQLLMDAIDGKNLDKYEQSRDDGDNSSGAALAGSSSLTPGVAAAAAAPGTTQEEDSGNYSDSFDLEEDL